ncbi:MAG: hypothetical protein R3F59_30245 [Myxococcota bacterium]
MVGRDVLDKRIEAATQEAAALDRVLELVREGASRSEAIRTVLPDRPVESMLRRLREYEAGGRDALVSKRFVVRKRKMTDEVRGGLRALAVADPTASAEILAERIGTLFGVTVAISTVQIALQELGLARPHGRPTWRTPAAAPAPVTDAEPEQHEEVEPLALAGAELLKAVEEECGAVAALSSAMDAHLAELPAPTGPIEHDRDDRDERGRFLASYNVPAPRTEPELGERFDSVALQRASKDLRQMRVAVESSETRHRKNLALVLLPIVVRSARWSELDHWRGGQLEELVGYAYQASTLDKYVRELKYGACADALREAVGAHWTTLDGEAADAQTGAVAVYIDAVTKPVWTHHWTRAAPVSKNGRVMPANTTVMLHSGGGTPLVYRSFSGQVALPSQVAGMLLAYEKHAGEGTARRVVVIDREGHTVALFKALHPQWGFIVPLKNNVLGPRARFEEVGPWTPYGAGPDAVCDGFLWLNDNRPGEEPLRIRVVGRRRHRTNKVAWFGTMEPAEAVPAADVIRLYFERWPAQEHVFRDGNGLVGLDVHHGYGKRKVDNVAVLDRLERLTVQVARCDARAAAHEAQASDLRAEAELLQEALDRSVPLIEQDRAAWEAALERGDELTDDERSQYATLRIWDEWVRDTRQQAAAVSERLQEAEASAAKVASSREKKRAEIEQFEGRRQIFTVDVELDELMTAYKLTFMNLAKRLMRRYLDLPLELETLIEAVLTLAGERARTETTETIRIYRHPRDKKVMDAVSRACERLTARGLRRGDRALVFEMVDQPRSKPDRSDPRSRPP